VVAPKPGAEGGETGGDGVARRDRRERKARRRMPVHGRSLEAIMNAIRKRARRNKTDRPERKR